MDQARSTISKIFNGEPHSYTRFNLTQNMEGDNSHVEMMSSDVNEEAGGNGVGEHLNHKSNHKPYMAQAVGRSSRSPYFMAAAALLIFVIGCLIGYLVQSKTEAAPSCLATCVEEDQKIIEHETGAAPLMDWEDVKKLLAERLTPTNFEQAFGDFTSSSHRAGSKGDEELAEKLHNRFASYKMKVWTDEHYVTVHDPPASGYNRFVFRGQTEEHPQGFLAYSATGNVTGAVLYASYGQEEEFRSLQDKGIQLADRVMLVKAGKISFAEKVANAARVGAAAVLIYPGPEYTFPDTTELFGHVHLGSGDPYTPAFPSFNHTQFPPVQSSGLPRILAQTITARMATSILRELRGENLPRGWSGVNRLGDMTDVISLWVDNVRAEKKIHNVFGVIKGFVDPDRYVVIGARRDAWGPGFATSTVGTSILAELARTIMDMVEKGGFKPRRSIVFASWSAGEYGSVGATEWLEGYLSSLSMKAFAYIDLDGVVGGRNGFKVSGSPLMDILIKNALDEVTFTTTEQSLASQFSKGTWEANIKEDMKMDGAAYPFLAFSGIPSVSFRFTSGNTDYPFFGTTLDTRERLNAATATQVPELAVNAAKFAGHMALRLVHDHLLRMDVMKYSKIISTQVARINRKVKAIKGMQLLPEDLTMQWLMSAAGSYSRAARNLAYSIDNSDLDDIEMCRIINDRIMAVERNFLTPYESPRDTPFRHILLDTGAHSVKGLLNHLDAFTSNKSQADTNLFRNQFALVTWTIQGCANSLAGDIWSLDNQI